MREGASQTELSPVLQQGQIINKDGQRSIICDPELSGSTPNTIEQFQTLTQGLPENPLHQTNENVPPSQ